MHYGAREAIVPFGLHQPCGIISPIPKPTTCGKMVYQEVLVFLTPLPHVQVYIFPESNLRAQFYLNYSKAQVIVDGRHRARLVIFGPGNLGHGFEV